MSVPSSLQELLDWIQADIAASRSEVLGQLDTIRDWTKPTPDIQAALLAARRAVAVMRTAKDEEQARAKAKATIDALGAALDGAEPSAKARIEHIPW